MPVPTALRLTDCLIDALMVLARQVAAVATGRREHPVAPRATQSLAVDVLSRLSGLVARLVHLAAARPRVPWRRAPRPPTAAPRPRTPSGPALPRRPGWLLAILPEAAPVAAEIRALLADPALAARLAAAPTLRRALAPVLRGLGVTPPSPAPPPPAPPPSDPPQPTPPPSTDPAPTRAAPSAPNRAPLHPRLATP